MNQITENRKNHQTKSQLFERINKINSVRKREKTQVTKIKNGSGDVTTNITEIKRVKIKEYK